MVREARLYDLKQVLELYLHLHEDSVPGSSEHLQKTWAGIIADKNHHLLVKEVDGLIVSSCVCVIIPNLTRGIRPYAFIENVVTHATYRKRGYATECLNHAREIAMEANCYKMMLLSGAKDEPTLSFLSSCRV